MLLILHIFVAAIIKMDTMMKKILLLMAVALPFVLISCDDDKDEPLSIDGHEYVDLGLPSGTLWATCNVGADSPEEYGDYFAWGETTPKEEYKWSAYKWCNGSYHALTKYCTRSDFGNNGFVDNKTVLDPEDDAAYVNWGQQWRMPTKEQLGELIEKCTWLWTTRNGVKGNLVTGPNGKTMFLPAAGCRFNRQIVSSSMDGLYWSSTLSPLTPTFTSPHSAWFLGLDSEGMYMDHNNRNDGFSVRAVRVP
jgi:hypothetical protein